MRVSDIMQKGVITVSPELPVRQFEELLTSEEISGAPVVDRNGILVGIASKSDIVRALGEALDERAEEWPGDELSVEDIMSTGVVTVAADADVKAVARRMVDGRLHRVLVLEGGDIVGIVTSLDLVKLLT